MKRKKQTPEERKKQKIYEQTPAGRLSMKRRNLWRYKHKQYWEQITPTPNNCECCGGPPTAGKSLAVDHDHATNNFRGWLCFRCNTGIGHLGDTLAGVTKALIYLSSRKK